MKETKRGRFIVFEGIDGAGKTTQIDLLAKYLRANGRQVYCTAEPTESVSGGLLRDALSGVSHRTVCEMAAMFVFDRIHHNVNPVNGIQKMLADGFDEQSRNDGRIHTAGQGKKDLLVAYLGTDLRDLLTDKRFRQLGGGDAFHGFGTNIALHRDSSKIKRLYALHYTAIFSVRKVFLQKNFQQNSSFLPFDF